MRVVPCPATVRVNKAKKIKKIVFISLFFANIKLIATVSKHLKLIFPLILCLALLNVIVEYVKELISIKSLYVAIR